MRATFFTALHALPLASFGRPRRASGHACEVCPVDKLAVEGGGLSPGRMETERQNGDGAH